MLHVKVKTFKILFLLQFLAFPSGLIRGALSNFGLTCSVSADVLSMPKCMYNSHLMIFMLKENLGPRYF